MSQPLDATDPVGPACRAPREIEFADRTVGVLGLPKDRDATLPFFRTMC